MLRSATATIIMLAALAEGSVNEIREPVLAQGTALTELRRAMKRRLPPLKVSATSDEWLRQATELRHSLLKNVVLRGVPSSWLAHRPRIIETGVIDSVDGYSVRKLRYDILPNLWIPALLYEPAIGPGPSVAGVLSLDGHVGADGKANHAAQARCINLARRGIVTLHPEWFNNGELRRPEFEHTRLAYLDLYAVSGLSVFYLYLQRALDVLASLPGVDSTRLGVTGLSGGGWQTLLLAALDTRVALSVPVAGYIGFDGHISAPEDIGDLEENPADLGTLADYTHLTAMLAPRPALLIYNSRDECCYRSSRARESVYTSVAPFYELFASGRAFEYYENSNPGTHNYGEDNRRRLYGFLNRYGFSRPPLDDHDFPAQVRTYGELNVGLPDGASDFVTLARELARSARQQTPTVESLRSTLRFRPMRAEEIGVEQRDKGPEHVRRYTLRIGEEWTVPAVVVSPREEPRMRSHPTVIVAADKGRAEMADEVVRLADGGARVIAVDLLFMGENSVAKNRNWLYAEMLSALGERPLGIQAAQLGAIVEWVRSRFKTSAIELHAFGPRSSVATLAAAAMGQHRLKRLLLHEAPKSLSLLVSQQADYTDYPEIFCFGLLPSFDLATLAEMSATKVDQHSAGGAREQ